MNKKYLALLIACFTSFSYANQYIIMSDASGMVQPPVITASLTVDKSIAFPGNQITVTWNVVGKTNSITLNGVAVTTASGTKTISPTTSGSFILIADNGHETKTQTVSYEYRMGSSCNELYTINPSMSDGVYQIKVNSNTFSVYCKKGWTMIGAEYEDNVIPWTGNMVNYNPSVNNYKSFMLPSAYIPPHSDFAVGKEKELIVQLKNFTYTTGNIPKTRLTGYDNAEYLIHRSSSSNYSNHDPDSTLYTTTSAWGNTLTVELTKTASGAASLLSDYTWSFSPGESYERAGFGMLGNQMSIRNYYGWTIWVK